MKIGFPGDRVGIARELVRKVATLSCAAAGNKFASGVARLEMVALILRGSWNDIVVGMLGVMVWSRPNFEMGLAAWVVVLEAAEMRRARVVVLFLLGLLGVGRKGRE